MVGRAPNMSESTHTRSRLLEWPLWLFGFAGSHELAYGRPVLGTIWFYAGVPLRIGWISAVLLIPSMVGAADGRFVARRVNHSVA